MNSNDIPEENDLEDIYYDYENDNKFYDLEAPY